MSTTEAPPAVLISDFPYDVALECLARVPVWHHWNLYGVSKSMRSLLKSPDFLFTRSNLNCPQHVLYLTLLSSDRYSCHILYRIPDASGQDFKILAVKVPPIPVQSIRPSSFALLGKKIYAFAGYVNGEEPSSDMWVLDCRNNTWEQGPSMQLGRQEFLYGVVDGKIYATDSEDGKVFDPVSGRWEEQDFEKWFYSDYIAGGRFYANYDVDVTFEYNPRKKEWDDLGNDEVEASLDVFDRNSCVIDGLLYYCDSKGNVRGYDAESGEEFRMEALVFPGGFVANVGGRLGVVWKKKGKEMKRKRNEEEEENGKEREKEKEKEKEKQVEIWYAEIELNIEEKDGDEYLHAITVFSGKVLSVLSGLKFHHFAGVTL